MGKHIQNLGIKDIKLLNITLLAKWKWMFRYGKKDMWKGILLYALEEPKY